MTHNGTILNVVKGKIYEGMKARGVDSHTKYVSKTYSCEVELRDKIHIAPPRPTKLF